MHLAGADVFQAGLVRLTVEVPENFATAFTYDRLPTGTSVAIAAFGGISIFGGVPHAVRIVVRSFIQRSLFPPGPRSLQ
jgi:hypothetical protein